MASATTRCPEEPRWTATFCSRSPSRSWCCRCGRCLQPKSPPKSEAPPAAEAPAPSAQQTAALPRAGRSAAERPACAGASPTAPARGVRRSRRDDAVARSLYLAELSSQGATLRDWELGSYFDRHGERIRLSSPGDGLATASTPFPELGLGDLSQQTWRVETQSDTEVRFAWQRGGVQLRKTYTFSDDDYDFRLRIDVSNQSAAPIAPAFSVEMPIVERAGNDFTEQNAAALHVGKLQVTPLASLGGAGFFGWRDRQESR